MQNSKFAVVALHILLAMSLFACDAGQPSSPFERTATSLPTVHPTATKGAPIGPPSPTPTEVTPAVPETYPGVPPTTGGWPHIDSETQIPELTRYWRKWVNEHLSEVFAPGTPSVNYNSGLPDRLSVSGVLNQPPAIVDIRSYSIIDPTTGLENYFVIRAFNNEANTDDPNEKIIVWTTWIGQSESPTVKNFVAATTIRHIHTPGGIVHVWLFTNPDIAVPYSPMGLRWFSDNAYAQKLAQMHDTGVFVNMDEPIMAVPLAP